MAFYLILLLLAVNTECMHVEAAEAASGSLTIWNVEVFYVKMRLCELEWIEMNYITFIYKLDNGHSEAWVCVLCRAKIESRVNPVNWLTLSLFISVELTFWFECCNLLQINFIYSARNIFIGWIIDCGRENQITRADGNSYLLNDYGAPTQNTVVELTSERESIFGILIW